MNISGRFVAATAAVGLVAFAIMYWVMDSDLLYSALITLGYFAIALVAKGMRTKKENT